MTGSTTILSYTNTGDELQVETIEKLMPDTLYEILVASENSIGMGSFSEDHLLAVTTSFGKPIELFYNCWYTVTSIIHCVLKLINLNVH